MIFGPIAHVGVRESVGHRHVGQVGTRTSAERPTARGEDDAPHFFSRVVRGAQALVHRTVFAVDGNDEGSGHRAQRLHDGARRNEALFVGESESLAGAQRLERHGQAGETDDRVHHHVGRTDDVGEIARHFGKGKGVGDTPTIRFISDDHHGGPELLGLTDDGVDRRADGKCDHLVCAAFGTHDVERLRADGAGRAGDRDPDWRYFTQGWMTSIR